MPGKGELLEKYQRYFREPDHGNVRVEEIAGLTCGARSKRTGKPCQKKDIFINGRCRFHGGLSTGPRTESGKQASRQNGKKGGRPRKDALRAIRQEPGPMVSPRLRQGSGGDNCPHTASRQGGRLLKHVLVAAENSLAESRASGIARRRLSGNCGAEGKPDQIETGLLGKPDPMKASKNLTFVDHRSPQPESGQALRCCADCANLSAAHTCMVGEVGNWRLWARHHCGAFARSQWFQ
ncbi:MAG: HGGxSTG domain-containing protein [Sulfuriferula sp.]